MIKFALDCACGYRFDAWFQSGDAFEDQSARGLLSCPLCGGLEVRKALMAPSVSTRSRARGEDGAPLAASTGDAATQGAPATPGSPAAQLRAMAAMTPDARRRAVEERLRALRAHIEATSDYVGPGFADEARRIHTGETDARAIYGETTPEEAEALRDEGVPIAAIPWIDRRDD